jgi:hypothetical protein
MSTTIVATVDLALLLSALRKRAVLAMFAVGKIGHYSMNSFETMFSSFTITARAGELENVVCYDYLGY